MTKASRMIVLVLALVMALSMSVLAVDVNFLGEFTAKLESQSGDELLPFKFSAKRLDLRLRASGTGYAINLNNIASVTSATGNASWGSPRYHASIKVSDTDVDIWGNQYEGPARTLKADPVNLVVMGLRGDRTWLRSRAHRQAPTNHGKVQASPKLINGVNTTFAYHWVSNNIGNVEIYTDTKINQFDVGAIVRHQAQTATNMDSTVVALFGESKFGEFKVGATLASRFADSVDEGLAYGVVVDTDVIEGINLKAQYSARQKDYYLSNTHDSSFQNSVFQGQGASTGSAGNAIEIVGTYRGGGGSNFVDFVNALAPPTWKSFGMQGVLRHVSDDSANPESILVLRGALPIVDKLWGAFDLRVMSDQDGYASLAGVAGDRRTELRAGLRYNLPKSPWYARLKSEIYSVSNNNNAGTTTKTTGEVVYASGKVENIIGLVYDTSSQATVDPSVTFFSEFKIKF